MESRVELRGMSGDSFYVKDNLLIKRSRNNKENLRYSYNRQVEAYNSGAYPLRVVKPLGYKKGSVDSFSMEFINSPNLMKSKSTPDINLKILEYFNRGSVRKANGFKQLVIDYLDYFPESLFKRKILVDLNDCDDEYLTGYCHGDFGLANLIPYNGEVYLIDFTRPPINTILFDVAILRTTIKLNGCDTKLSLISGLDSIFKDYLPQINILNKLRAIQFYRDNVSLKHRRELEEWFSA